MRDPCNELVELEVGFPESTSPLPVPSLPEADVELGSGTWTPIRKLLKCEKSVIYVVPYCPNL